MRIHKDNQENKSIKEIKMEEKIKDAIGQIRPFLQRDGGDIEFVELTEDNVVKVKLQGHCAGCPGAHNLFFNFPDFLCKIA